MEEAVRLVGERAGGPEVRAHIAHHPAAARGDTLLLPIEVEPEDACRGRARGLLLPLFHVFHPWLLCVFRWWSVWRVRPAQRHKRSSEIESDRAMSARSRSRRWWRGCVRVVLAVAASLSHKAAAPNRTAWPD